jgi:hypothetical protein
LPLALEYDDAVRAGAPNSVRLGKIAKTMMTTKKIRRIKRLCLMFGG